MLKYTLLFVIIVTSFACKKFLTEIPDNRATIDTKSEIKALLVNAYPGGHYSLFAESMSDNAGDKGTAASNNEQISEKAFKFEDFETSTIRDATSYFWDGCYGGIAHANQALESINKLEDPASVDYLKGEAYACRAFNHFLLTLFFSMRYDSTTAASAQGVPYVEEVEKEAIKSYTRPTLAKTYEKIERDLQLALALVNNIGHQKKLFHFTRTATLAFAVRFYKHKGNWTKVLEYANRLIGASELTNFCYDYGSEKANTLTYTVRRQRFQSSTEPSNILITYANSVIGRQFASGRYALTSAKRGEMGFTNPFGKRSGIGVYGGNALVYNVPKYNEYFRITNASQGIGFPFNAQVHFRTDDVLLARAEAYAMLDRFAESRSDLAIWIGSKTRAYNVATDVLSDDQIKALFPKKINDYSPFYGLSDNQYSYVKAIAEYRRLFEVHEGRRWFDVKRFDIPVVHTTMSGDTIRLLAGDKRRALQVPQYAQEFGVTATAR